MSNKFFLIDGRNTMHRHQCTNDHLSRSSDGKPTGGLYGCLNAMLGLARKLPDAGIVWIWDGKGETWRHKFMQDIPQLDAAEFPEVEEKEESDDDNSLESIGSKMITDSMVWLQPKILDNNPFKKEKKRGYKANRHHGEKPKSKSKWPEDVRERVLLQVPILQAILNCCGIRSYEVEGLECDDLLAMVARKIIKLDDEAEVYIHSGDKDYYQLLRWKQVQIVTRIKDGKLFKVEPSYVESEYGVKPKHWAKYEALTGGHNNVSHLRNIGSVRAKAMLADGIDPSKPECPKIDEKWAKYFPHGIQTMWPSVNGNYKLCRLVDDYRDELLSVDVRKKLLPMFDHFDDVKRFYRSSKGKTSEAWRRVGFLLAEYELNSILARREQLWQIP